MLDRSIARLLSRRTAAFGLVAVLALPARAQFCDQEVTQIVPAFQSQFGASVDISATTAVVGAPQAPDGTPCPGTEVGTVTVFELQAGVWSAVAELNSPNADCDGQFGYDVAVAGSTILVGAPFEDVGGFADAGRVYVFRRIGGAWTFTQELTELVVDANARFGHSVDVNGERMAVGSLRSGFFGPDAGAVYLYRRSNGMWQFEDRVGPSPILPDGFFGTSVAVHGSTLAVGAVYDSQNAFQAGAAYVFERQPNTSWNLVAKLNPPVIQPSSFFGISVDTRDDAIVVVGAEGVSNGAPGSGSAFVYTPDPAGVWMYRDELTCPTPNTNGAFGRVVSVCNGRVLVTDVTQPGGGASYLYRQAGGGTWPYDRPLLALMPTPGDAFGVEASLVGDQAIVGALVRSTSAPFSGSAFIYDVEFEDCNGNGMNDQCDLIQDPTLDCDGNGEVDSCEIFVDPTLDCDTDGVLDSCQIAMSPAIDCDGNGQIDDCEIASNASLDCNGNLVLDVCDIAGGEPDVNQNSIPDVCEPIGANPGCQTIPNSTGVVSSLAGIGSGTLAGNDIVLVGSEMPLMSFGYPIVSRTAVQTIPPNSIGFRCVGGSVGRDLGNLFNTGATGAAVLPIDLLSIPTPSGPQMAVVGETLYWQLWHRDSIMGNSTSSFTDSLVIMVM